MHTSDVRGVPGGLGDRGREPESVAFVVNAGQAERRRDGLFLRDRLVRLRLAAARRAARDLVAAGPQLVVDRIRRARPDQDRPSRTARTFRSRWSAFLVDQPGAVRDEAVRAARLRVAGRDVPDHREPSTSPAPELPEVARQHARRVDDAARRLRRTWRFSPVGWITGGAIMYVVCVKVELPSFENDAL